MSTGVTAGVSALSQLYGFGASAARFAVEHIETLKQADNLLAARCGHVLEAANAGFGVGGETALVLIGVGQTLLGNPLAGGAVLVAAHNPVVMTCAAIGAIHYGWKAMNDREREALLRSVGTAFDVGIELVRSIASFAYNLIQKLMSKENFAELKRMVTGVAKVFGRHFSDVSRLLSDRIREAAGAVGSTVGGAASAAWALAPSVRLRALTRGGTAGKSVDKG